MVLTENNYETSRRGSIEVICGSMFSGKTEELIRRLKRAKIARQKVEIFKPAIDVRYSEENIVSHDSTSILSTPVDNSHSILLMASGVDVVGIDEAQFFDDGIVEVCSELADVYKVHAICVKCGHLANYSYRLVDNDKRVLLGEKNEYQPLCRRCYLQEIQERKEKHHEG